ncbi:MAG: tetratricopeptide (TPR) repeat protein [Planctomycetota bacterium]|jgi:tetratricopeptide (TPR) repeat protein
MKTFFIVAAFVFAVTATEAESLYKGGQFKESYVAFEEIASAVDDDARGAAYFNVGLAAYQAGRLVAAEVAFEKADAWGHGDFGDLHGFMNATIEFARCLRGEVLSKRVEAGLPAFDIAIAAGQRAQLAWEEVILQSPDWQPAKRNLERTLMKLADLERRRQEFVKKSKKNSTPKDNPAAEKDGKSKEEKKQDFEEQVDANLTALMSNEVGEVLKLIKKKEAQKKKLRLKQRTKTTSSRGRDW